VYRLLGKVGFGSHEDVEVDEDSFTDSPSPVRDMSLMETNEQESLAASGADKEPVTSVTPAVGLVDQEDDGDIDFIDDVNKERFLQDDSPV